MLSRPLSPPKPTVQPSNNTPPEEPLVEVNLDSPPLSATKERTPPPSRKPSTTMPTGRSQKKDKNAAGDLFKRNPSGDSPYGSGLCEPLLPPPPIKAELHKLYDSSDEDQSALRINPKTFENVSTPVIPLDEKQAPLTQHQDFTLRLMEIALTNETQSNSATRLAMLISTQTDFGIGHGVPTLLMDTLLNHEKLEPDYNPQLKDRTLSSITLTQKRYENKTYKEKITLTQVKRLPIVTKKGKTPCEYQAKITCQIEKDGKIKIKIKYVVKADKTTLLSTDKKILEKTEIQNLNTVDALDTLFNTEKVRAQMYGDLIDRPDTHQINGKTWLKFTTTVFEHPHNHAVHPDIIKNTQTQIQTLEKKIPKKEEVIQGLIRKLTDTTLANSSEIAQKNAEKQIRQQIRIKRLELLKRSRASQTGNQSPPAFERAPELTAIVQKIITKHKTLTDREFLKCEAFAKALATWVGAPLWESRKKLVPRETITPPSTEDCRTFLLDALRLGLTQVLQPAMKPLDTKLASMIMTLVSQGPYCLTVLTSNQAMKLQGSLDTPLFATEQGSACTTIIAPSTKNEGSVSVTLKQEVSLREIKDGEKTDVLVKKEGLIVCEFFDTGPLKINYKNLGQNTQTIPVFADPALTQEALSDLSLTADMIRSNFNDLLARPGVQITIEGNPKIPLRELAKQALTEHAATDRPLLDELTKLELDLKQTPVSFKITDDSGTRHLSGSTLLEYFEIILAYASSAEVVKELPSPEIFFTLKALLSRGLNPVPSVSKNTARFSFGNGNAGTSPSNAAGPSSSAAAGFGSF